MKELIDSYSEEILILVSTYEYEIYICITLLFALSSCYKKTLEHQLRKLSAQTQFHGTSLSLQVKSYSKKRMCHIFISAAPL